MKLEGKVAIVTGAGRGIGRAISLSLAGEGADVAVSDIDSTAAGEVSGKIKAAGRQSVSVKADVSNSKDIDRLVTKTLNAFGRIDILINNAGVDKFIPTLEVSEGLWDNMLDINLKGQFLCSQAVAKQMIKQGGGKIVNIASIGGLEAMPGRAAYSASKAGVLHLTRVLAVEWAKYNINVNSGSPGATMTAMMEKNLKENAELLNSYIERIPLKRMAKPEEIAHVVLFLISPGSEYITGQNITIDGGLSALHPGFVPPKQ